MKSFCNYIKEGKRYNNAEEVLADISIALKSDEVLNPDFKRMSDAARREFGYETKSFKSNIYAMEKLAGDLGDFNDSITDFIWSIPWDSFQELTKFGKGIEKLKKLKGAKDKVKDIIDYATKEGSKIFNTWVKVRDDLKSIKPKVVKVTQKRIETKKKEEMAYAQKKATYAALTDALNQHKSEYVTDYKKQTISFVDKKIKVLEDAGWDLDKVVGKGRNADKEMRSFYYTITTSATKGYNPDAPNLRQLDTHKTKGFIDNAIKSAEASFEEFVRKMIEKVGEPVTSASMVGNIWNNSVLKVTTISGKEQVWNTKSILNFSKYGKPFNQFPTRQRK